MTAGNSHAQVLAADSHEPKEHASTHESGGSDEIDVTGLTGAGAPTEITDIPTAETDTTKVLAPDGAGGVEFRAESGGGGGPTELDYVELTSGTTNITATSEGTATAVITGSSVAYDGSTRVCIEVFLPGFWAADSQHIYLGLWEDSTFLGRVAMAEGHSGYSNGLFAFARLFRTPSNASHTYTAKAWVTSGTGYVEGGAGGAGNPVAGYIRVVTA